MLTEHEDRNEIKRRAEADFLNLFRDHGGRHRGKALHCLFHDDQSPSASIHKGRFHCFVCDLNLDVIEFVMLAQRVNFKSALFYLGDRYGIRLNNRALTDREKQEYAKRRRNAEKEAAGFLAWRDDMLEALRQTRDIFLRSYHRTLRLILTHSLNHPMADFWADACETCEKKYQDIDCRVDIVEQTSFTDLLPFYRARNRRTP